MHGSGTLYLHNGDVYEGIFRKGHATGQAILKKKDG